MDFYTRVCGFVEVYGRTPGLKAGFISNGNTHHDKAITTGKSVGSAWAHRL